MMTNESNHSVFDDYTCQTLYGPPNNETRWTFYDLETPDFGDVKIVKINKTLLFDKEENVAVYAINNSPRVLLNLISPPTDKMCKNIMKLNLGSPKFSDHTLMADAYSTISWRGLNYSAAELHTISVDKPIRRQGIGTEMLKLTTLDISRRGIKLFYGIMAGDMFGGITEKERKKFYDTMGFCSPTEREREIIGLGSEFVFASQTDNPLLQNPKSVRDDYLTDRIADILNGG
jgi:hypothetical protein